ncbi:MAG: translocation/assembly module TamB domain-containing protein, partial [Bacteroidales bacterium]
PGSGVSYVDNILDINNFVFYSTNQSIRINGSSAADSDQAIECSFQHIDLSWLDFLTIPYQVDLDGIINGDLTIRNLLSRPRILADLSIEQFAFNQDTMGSLNLVSLWDDQLKGMRLNADFIYQGNVGSKKTGEITGYIYPFKKNKDNFDLHIDLDNFRINILSNFLSDITSDVKGFASGKMHLGGPFNAPELTGRLKVNARTIFVDYLNTRYSFADSIFFTPNAIIFDNIQLSDNNRLNSRDPYSAKLSGTIGHKGFRDFSLNVNIRADNFTFMNTNGQQDPMYFGRALATGNVSITGPVTDILITVQARTERNTTLEIPLVFESEVSRSSFITFIDHREEIDVISGTGRRGPQSNLRLNFNLQVTPDATVRLIFDPLVGDVIEGSGSGNLLMNIDSNGEFDLRGQYVIAKGDYTFNLENLISKKFSVRPGGTIRWTGDPYDANIDIEAIYTTKASLAPLNMEDSTMSAQNVECVIHMNDKLFDPTITFDIEFPDLSSFDNERYQALIRPNLNYHFLTLLAISRFANVQSQQLLEAGSSANILGTNTTELLADQLSVWLSNISDDFEVDFAYHPGTGLSQEQVEAAFKTQVLNDRLTIESKVGIGGRTYADDAQRTSNMVGDIVAEYRIDREGRFRIKAFNRYNEQNILYEGAPYTQGVGVFYRKEFNSFRDLLKKREENRE